MGARRKPGDGRRSVGDLLTVHRDARAGGRDVDGQSGPVPLELRDGVLQPAEVSRRVVGAFEQTGCELTLSFSW